MSLCLFSSLLLDWPVLEIYIMFCVLLVVLLMFLLSQDRSLGRCFQPAGKLTIDGVLEQAVY